MADMRSAFGQWMLARIISSQEEPAVADSSYTEFARNLSLTLRPASDTRPMPEMLRTEILSGLTVALALVPEAVAFAFVAGVHPLVGLYAAFLVGLITALIGGQDLGQEIYRALPTSDAGRGVMAGLGIASMGIIADRLIGAWADKRKQELGIA